MSEVYQVETKKSWANGFALDGNLSRDSQFAVAHLGLGTSSHDFLLKIIGSAVRVPTKVKTFTFFERANTKTAFRGGFCICALDGTRTHDLSRDRGAF
jgi:hypothetical protein